MNSKPVPAGRVRFTSTVALSLTFLVIFVSAVVVAKVNYPAEAASMPLIIGGFGAALSLQGGFGAALSLLQLIVELHASRGAYEEQIDLKRDIPIYLWVWSFVIAVTAFGFVLAAPVMLFVYLRFRSRESWWLSALLSLAVLGLLYGVFQTALGVPLFEGLATPRIRDWLMPAGAG
ncbi:MAG TPA: tripartite tricarboxylate transporter TctB family protein [Steroidobacteraceae bacterium]